MDKNNPNNLTPEQIKAGYSTIAGNYDPVTGKLKTQPSPLLNNLPATTNVSANTLGQGTSQLNLPTTPQPVIAQPTVSLADKAVLDTQTQLTDAQKVQESTIGKQMEAILGMNALGTEAQTKQAELDKLGYQQKLQDYNNLNSQILQKQAELSQSDIQLVANMRAQENRDTLLPFAQMGQAKLQGDAAIMRALKTSEIGVLNAQVLAKQGDISMAQQMAQDAVDAKFAPYKAQIQMYSDVLKALDPILTRDEKKQANEQALRGQIALKEIDKLSKFQSDALSAAISNNAPQSVINAITKGQTIEEITKAGAGYLKSKADILDERLKQEQINTSIANREKINAERTALGQPGGGKAPTQTQIEYAGYADRISQANNIIDAKADTFKNMKYMDFQLASSNSQLANKLLTDDQRQAAQAMRNFITAKLRKESGASISPSEFADARVQYFPALGDDETTLANKKVLRDSVLQNNILGAGSAYNQSIDPTTAYFQTSSKVITSSNDAKSSFLQEYNSRK